MTDTTTSNFDFATLTEPLPAKLPTLDFLPTALRPYYSSRDFSGNYVLGYVYAEDALSRDAHLDAIAKGRVQLIPAGESVASLAERAAQSAAGQRAFEEALAAGEKAQMERQLAALAAREQKGTVAFREQEAAIRARGGR